MSRFTHPGSFGPQGIKEIGLPVTSRTRVLGKLGSASVLDPIFALLALLLPLIISLHLLGTDLLGNDFAEFTLGVSTLGIVQFPGYPLYLMATKLVTWLVPYGSEIWRINFASLIYAALAALLIFLTGRRLYFSSLISLAAALLFFFSPFLWQTALVAHYDTFLVFLITACVYTTLDILNPRSLRNLKLKLTAWAFLCGLTGAQHPALIAWVITALIMGLVIGLPRQRSRSKLYWLVIISALAGACLPYLYLPLRLLSPNALFNPDLVSLPGITPPSESLKALFFWFVSYCSDGAQTLLMIKNFHAAVRQFWETVVGFAMTYPFFPLMVIIFGLLLNLRTALLRQPGTTTSGIDSAGRLTLAILPLCALGGELLLLQEHTHITRLNLSLGCAFWSFIGLEYCYQILGHTDVQLSKIQHRLKPTWFGIMVVLCIPLLAFIQSYSLLKKHIPQAANPDSTLIQTQRFMESLPENAALYFPRAQWQFPFTYVQIHMDIRQDLFFKSFSKSWPDMQLDQNPFFRTLGQTPQQRFLKEITFSREWIRILSRKTRPGTHQFLLTRPMKPKPTLQFLLQSLQVLEAHAPLAYWETPRDKQFLSVFRIRRRANEDRVTDRKPLTKTFIRDFNGKFRLVSAQLHKPVKRIHQFALLKITLTWQKLTPLQDKKILVLFRIVPATGRPESPRAEKAKTVWKEARLLGGNGLRERFHARSILHETYQLPVPKQITPGRYQVQIALQDKQNNEMLPTGDALDKPVYFISACEFWVVDSTSEGVSDANP
ncbi:DUF2723 domain-containing protein [bacterium]|nr:DUF2723 domain-containing protein [bacterium]